MLTAVQISTQFINDTILPLLKQHVPDDYRSLAVAVIGTGSDVHGLDDEISRDHHWGPRANVMYLRQDADRLGPKIKKLLNEKIPKKYQDFDVHIDIGNLTGVCFCSLEDFLEKFLGTDLLPQTDLDWLKLCEVDLLHVTAGRVVYDGKGELTRRRKHLANYPDQIWRKRIADWCMYATGRDGPYNIHRAARRGDEITATFYMSQCFRRQMELCFTLNKQYAPYPKWLNRTFRQLPRFADQIASILDEVVAITDWRQRVLKLVDANYLIANAIAELGLTAKPPRLTFDEGLTDLTLYDSAAQIYAKLPRELMAPSFNQIELWERMARDVLFDTSDYFQKYHEQRT